MKTLFLILNFLVLSSVFAQGGGGLTGGNVGPKPTDDNRVLLDALRDRANNPLLNNTGGLGSGGGPIGPNPIGDERVLLEVLHDRAINPRHNYSGGVNTGGGYGGGVPPIPRPTTGRSSHTRTITLGGHTVTVNQDELDAINTAGYRNNKRDEVLPTRLHIESINLSSDEVSEITLKDGSVVKVEDLQEFVREKMKEKLNQ